MLLGGRSGHCQPTAAAESGLPRSRRFAGNPFPSNDLFTLRQVCRRKVHGLDAVQLCHANVSMSVIARMDKLSASDSFRFQHMRKQLAAVLGAANIAGHIQAIAWHHDA